MDLPVLTQPLGNDHLKFIGILSTSCRQTIIRMLKQSQSGHPGGSLSSIDYLSVLYAFIISQTGEPVVVSNGHISPAVYSILAELGYIDKTELIQTFRKIGSPFEGHITRHISGIIYGTGPLGIGGSVATGLAISMKYSQQQQRIYGIMGDGETDEGQVYEMMTLAVKYRLDNLIIFMDYNKVQLTASLEKILPLDILGHFRTAGWEVLELDGHDYRDIWSKLRQAQTITDRPVLLLGHTIMGKGISFMEETGREYLSTWHGKAPSSEQADQALTELILSKTEQDLLENFRKHQVVYHPEQSSYPAPLTKDEKIQTATPIIYKAGTITDCRSAYGAALLDLARHNPQIMVLTADVRGSVKTDGVARELPRQFIEVGISEQNMVSVAGGLSIAGQIPFVSTFGVFLSSRAKDQARVNDINATNVKMVATHCGLSVGEDGPTHQAIDDSGSFLGFFNTMLLESVDANQTDRLIRFIASHYGNFYLRMGRHKYPVILREDGNIFYGDDYDYYYGRTDTIRSGGDITVIASGAMVNEALKARELFSNMEIIGVSSIKQFDQNLRDSIARTGRVLTVEDHNPFSGLATQIGRFIQTEGLEVTVFRNLGVENYQLSGQSLELYAVAGIDGQAISDVCREILDA